MRPCPHSTMRFPALSTNEPRAKHALAALPCGLILAKHGRGRRPPRVYDCALRFYCIFCIIFLLHFPHYFSHLGFRYMKSARASCPGAWLLR